MNVEQNTGKPARLSLQERAKQGLLLTEPELSLDDIVNLEHPGDLAGRKALRLAIRAAIDYGDLATRNEVRTSRIVRKQSGYWPVGTWLIGAGDPPEKTVVHTQTLRLEFIDREAYQAWRNACPAELLSPLSQVHKWLGAMPALPKSLPVETSLPELPGPSRLTEAQQDKADCQAIARALWAEQPGATQADILKNSRIKPYLKTWPGKNTLPGWLSEVDPRPKEQRRGRPKAR